MTNALTMESTVGEVYNTPIGHDILFKILMQVGKPEFTITNPLVSHMKLKQIAPLTKRILDEGFWDAFLNLINSEHARPALGEEPVQPKWWKEAVFYQVYPRTFYDTNGDGVGDLKGITEKLDYLKDLGINAVWLSPIYDSPMDDNGYDIRDYQKINEDFGTMEDFDELLHGIHDRGMYLIMDLVVNHTSDEHVWFQQAISSSDNLYRDYYFIRSNSAKAPNNWTSFFAGNAWDQYGEQNDWALHLFAKKQIDLNWDNPQVRKSVENMVNWWLEKGVDGFRMDVINYISKAEGLPQGDLSIGKLMGYTGIEHYFYGQHLHKYLHEIHENCFEPHNAFSIGETPGLGIQMCQLVTGEERHELDMVFSFDHLETPGHVRWDDYVYDLNYYRDYMIDWMTHYGNQCWMSLFYNNHDNPRMVSKIDPNGKYTAVIEELLAVMQFTMKGTPFVFQGDEMGLTNLPFHSISELNDVESKNYYQELLANGKNKEEAWKTILAGTRDHVRQMLPWNTNELPDHLQQTIKPEITKIYKYLIALRKAHSTLIYGDFTVLNGHHNRFVYRRSNAAEDWIIDCNLAGKECRPYHTDTSYSLVWPLTLKGTALPPYGARIWQKVK